MKHRLFLAFRLKEFLLGSAAVALCSACIFLLDFDYLIDAASGSVNTENEVVKIIIDPGHGEFDGGTQSDSGVIEKDINLAISLKLRDILNLMGYETIMTRDCDIVLSDKNATTIRQKKSTDLKNRLTIINNNPESLFVSIHQNYFTQSKYSGTQVFYSVNNPHSELLAQAIQESVSENLQKDNKRQIKPSGSEIYLLYKALSPAVMIECGFLSNSEETELLISEEYQKKMALAITDGINKYLDNRG